MNISDLDLETEVYPCPICGGSNFITLAKSDRHLLGIKTTGCKKCGLVQTNPRLSVNGLDNFYRNSYREFYQGVTTPSEDYVLSLNKDERLRYTAKRIIEKCKLTPDSIVLDYGCGEGSLFVALKNTGFMGIMFGVEPNENFANYASERSGAIVLDTLEKIDTKVSCVVVNHVLEHLHNPVEFLKKISLIIEPDGLIYIDVPDVDLYTSVNDLHIAHLYHFNERTLKMASEKAGYIILDCEKHSPPYHPKSITVVLKKSLDKIYDANLRGCELSEESWRVVQKIQRDAWLFKLKNKLRKIPLCIFVYRIFKKKHLI